MKKHAWASIAFLGGIIALIGVFLPWAEVVPGAGTVSAWDMSDVIAISGSVMILLGALAAGISGALRSMISVGGLLALADGVAVYKAYTTVDYGIWVVLVGSIIALIATIGIISAKK